MAWTAPMTAALNATFTAAQFNTNVRDNLLETAAAKISTPSRYAVAVGPNSLETRGAVEAFIDTFEGTTSTTFTDLATVGPELSISTGTRALVMFYAQPYETVANESKWMSVAVSGNTTIAASEFWGMLSDGVAADNNSGWATYHLFDNLNPGPNKFTCKYKTGGSGTASFDDRRLAVMPF